MKRVSIKKCISRSQTKFKDTVLRGAVPASDRGFLYGDGLFETIAIQSGYPLILAAHIDRLAEGCQRLDIPIDAAMVRKSVLESSKSIDLGIVRVSLTRGEGGEGYKPPEIVHPNVIISTRPWPHRLAKFSEEGIETGVSKVNLSRQPLLAGLKHMNRLEQVMARRHSPTAWPEVIMTSTSNQVIEGSYSNIFFLGSKEELITPDLSYCGVAGVIRDAIINLANDEGRPVIIRDVRFSELLSAQELFFTNSIIGVWPVRKLERRSFDIGVAREIHAKLKLIGAVVNA
jgi:4-amino-4-deoxychorismate lyase